MVWNTATTVAVTVVMTKVSRKKTTAFAASTRPRLGQAVSVVRIMPVLYSEPMVSTPSVITQIEPSSTPKKPSPSAGSPDRPASFTASSSAVPNPIVSISATITPSVQTVARTERILVHSEATASPRVAGRIGIGDS